MKPLELFLLALLLTGCSQSPPVPQPPTSVDAATDGEAAITAQSIPPQVSDAVDPEPDQTGQAYLPVADWLVQRRVACNQDWESIEAQLNRYEQALKQQRPQPNQDVVHAYTQLKALMLATCNPARTPGVLKNLLDRVGDYDWPAEYMALFDLLESEYSAYALLEEKYQDLQQTHQKTIDGIGNIERSLDSDVDASN